MRNCKIACILTFTLGAESARAESTTIVEVDGTPRALGLLTAERPPAALVPSPSGTSSAWGSPLPRLIDLRGQQTGFRDQGARNTCTVFAVTAALEAAYKRDYGLELDLSEQWLNQVQKAHWLNAGALLPGPEIQSGTNGGGAVSFELSALTRYGLPEEVVHPYIPHAVWENTSGWIAPPSPTRTGVTQRELDDFVLSSVARDYVTPDLVPGVAIMPQRVLETARYRPTSIAVPSSRQLMDVDWFREQLAEGREVPFTFAYSSARPDYGTVWRPGKVPVAYHAMLIVGYDDAQEAFWVKNSWSDLDFILFSYDFIRTGQVVDAAVIQEVADPFVPFDATNNAQLWLGRWNLDFDGWRGILDIYRMPTFGTGADRRVGTYSDGAGKAHRVNAIMQGSRIDFHIDKNMPDQPADALQGDHFTGYLFRNHVTAMAGTMKSVVGGVEWAFQASKESLPAGVAAPVPLSPASYAGVWDLEVDGARGELELTVGARGTLTGRYRDSSGAQAHDASGMVTTDPRFMSLMVDTPQGTVTLAGALNSHERGVMSGIAHRNGPTMGFWAQRRGTTEPLPEEPSPPRSPCAARPWLPVCQ